MKMSVIPAELNCIVNWPYSNKSHLNIGKYKAAVLGARHVGLYTRVGMYMLMGYVLNVVNQKRFVVICRELILSSQCNVVAKRDSCNQCIPKQGSVNKRYSVSTFL